MAENKKKSSIIQHHLVDLSSGTRATPAMDAHKMDRALNQVPLSLLPETDRRRNDFCLSISCGTKCVFCMFKFHQIVVLCACLVYLKNRHASIHWNALYFIHMSVVCVFLRLVKCLLTLFR